MYEPESRQIVVFVRLCVPRGSLYVCMTLQVNGHPLTIIGACTMAVFGHERSSSL